jgi:hypothetical protein
MKTWGEEANPDHLEQMTEEENLEKLAHEYLEEVERRRGAEDPFNYTPWIASLPMPLTKEIEQGLRVNGLKLRKQIQADLKRKPLLWDALRRPASFHNAHRSLAEMLLNIPQPDHSQFTELGDGHVHMPLATMEKYLYPTLFLMRYLHERGGNNLPGGIEFMITYSFFAQGHLPQSRTLHDLSVLRNTVFPTGLDLQFQIRDNKESAEGLCSQLRSTLKRLKEVNDLPSWDKLVDKGQEMLDKRQEEIDSLLKLYTDQATKDYHTSMLDKERLLLYAHLSQQQAIQVLELHGRLAESMDKSSLLIEKALLRCLYCI